MTEDNNSGHPFDVRWNVFIEQKTYGPYTGHQIKEMGKKRQIFETDLVCRLGFNNWIEAGADPILRRALGPDAARTDNQNKPALRFLRTSTAVVIVVVFVIGWTAWPYYSVYQFAAAMQEGDASELQDRVAWDSVRQGLRGDFNALLLKKMNSEKDNMTKGFAVALGPTIINNMVDAYVTPEGLSSLIREGKPKPVDEIDKGDRGGPTPLNSNMSQASAEKSATFEQKRFPHKGIKYAFFDGGPFDFKIVFIPINAENNETVGLTFKWGGTWKLSRIAMPLDAIMAKTN